MKQANAVAIIVAVNTAPKSKKPFSGPANSPERIKGFKKVYPETGKVPRPDNWSGWVLEPTMLEFWLEGSNRIHERLRYFKEKKKWVKKLLNP